MRLKLFLLVNLLLLLVSTQPLSAQEGEKIRIKVAIVDTGNTPLPGAVVRIKGKNRGMAANAEGMIDIIVVRGDEIVVSYAGMKTRTIKISSPLTSSIVLQDNVSELDQVVVTGYAQTTKRRTTGSVSVISAEEILPIKGVSIDKMLQGVVAGVDIKNLSGRPGEGAKIRIRGINTLSGSAEPLWVVDGVPLQRNIPTIGKQITRTGDFSQIFASGIGSIPPSEIENITILKDASAAAIYGSQAAGGVIVVTTKRGSKGKMRVSYSGNVSLVTSPPRTPDLMNSEEKLRFEQELWDEFSQKRKQQGLPYPIIGRLGAIRAGIGAYAGMSREEQEEEIQRLSAHTTDWFKELFRNTYSLSHNVSLGGGSDTFTYYTSLGHEKNNGLLKQSDASRSHANVKLDIKPVERLKVGFTFGVTEQRSHNPNSLFDPFRYAYFANPYEKPYNDDGSYAPDETWRSLGPNHGYRSITLPPGGFNIMRELEETSSDTKNISVNLLSNINYRITDNFSFEGIASYGYVYNHSNNTLEKDSYAAWIDRPFEGQSTLSTRTYASNTILSGFNTNFLLRGQVNYFNSWKNVHNLSMLIGSEVRSQVATSESFKRYGYDSESDAHSTPPFIEKDKYTEADIRSLATLMTGLNARRKVENNFASFYFSTDYSYKGIYIVSLTARTDGSNNFGQKEQFNPTGSLGFSWNADRESWWETLKPVVSSFQLRAAGGYTGNAYRAAYPQLVIEYLQPYRNSNNATYRRGKVKSAPNDKLRWERTRDVKIGVDVGLLEDRFRLSFEAYDRLSSDLVSEVPLISSVGFRSQTFNSSSIRNQGVELTTSGSIIRQKDWGINASFNIAYNQNLLVKFDQLRPSYTRSSNVGYPLGSIFSGKSEGISPLLGIHTYKPRPDADLSTLKARKNYNNYIYYLGTSVHPVNGGFSLTGRYKNLTLSMGGSYSLGGLVADELNYPTTADDISDVRRNINKEPIPNRINDLYIYHLNTTKDAFHRWTPENPITDGRPRIIDHYGERLYLDNYMVSLNTITRASMLQNASFLRINSLSASYSFGQKELSRIGLSPLGISAVSFNASISNIALFTSYKGFDPETPGAIYPTPRTYNMGININF